MSEWHTFKLKDITTKIGSGSTPTGGSGAYKTEGISLIRSQNVLDYKFTEDGLAFIDDDQAYGLRNVIVEANDVLLNITGDSVARCCGAPTNWLPARVNQHVAILRSNPEKLDHRFLKYSLLASKEELLILSEIGGTRNALTKGMLEDYEVFLPSLPEQKAIASVLSSLDDKIDLLHRQNKTLEAMAETLFRQWFIEEAKEDWEIFQLQDLAKLQIGRTPPRKESHWFSDNTNDMKWVSIKDLGAHGIFVTYSSEYLPISTIDHFNIPIIPEGTVMLSFKMTVGRVGIAIENMVSNEAIAQFQIKKRLTSELLYCFLKQFNFDTLGSTSSIVTAVNTALLKGIEIALPEDDLIQEFTEQVKSYFDKVKANQLQIQTLENLRDTLLPKLMSGEVRVQYQTEEVA